MKKILFVIVLCLVLVGCQESNKQPFELLNANITFSSGNSYNFYLTVKSNSEIQQDITIILSRSLLESSSTPSIEIDLFNQDYSIVSYDTKQIVEQFNSDYRLNKVMLRIRNQNYSILRDITIN